MVFYVDESDFFKASNIFYVHAIEKMWYHKDEKGEYYYQDAFCRIYDTVAHEEDPKGFMQ